MKILPLTEYIIPTLCNHSSAILPYKNSILQKLSKILPLLWLYLILLLRLYFSLMTLAIAHVPMNNKYEIDFVKHYRQSRKMPSMHFTFSSNAL